MKYNLKELDIFKEQYYQGDRNFKNQSPYDLIANYDTQAANILIKFCATQLPKESYFIEPNGKWDTKARLLSTYTIKHIAEDFFRYLNYLGVFPYQYVSTGAIKGALLCAGYDLKPEEENAVTNIRYINGMKIREYWRNMIWRKCDYDFSQDIAHQNEYEED